MNINLNEHGDRVVTLKVTDKHGEVYEIGLEFLNHDFGSDEVQVLVHKLPKDHEKQMKEKGNCPTYSPNRILHNEEIIDVKRPDHYVVPSVWFEFHEIEGYPEVKS